MWEKSFLRMTAHGSMVQTTNNKLTLTSWKRNQNIGIVSFSSLFYIEINETTLLFDQLILLQLLLLFYQMTIHIILTCNSNNSTPPYSYSYIVKLTTTISQQWTIINVIKKQSTIIFHITTSYTSITNFLFKHELCVEED